MALTYLGNKNIELLTEDNPAANAVKFIYDTTKAVELGSYRWSFAVKRVVLTAELIAPLFGFDFKYKVPADFLKLEEIVEAPYYECEGGFLLTNSGNKIKIKYTANVAEAEFTDLFADVLAYKLAIKACEKTAQSSKKKADLYSEYNVHINNAKKQNALQLAARQLRESEFVDARY
jgi:hypothetical protein